MPKVRRRKKKEKKLSLNLNKQFFFVELFGKHLIDEKISFLWMLADAKGL
jgi:hypothetical protein